MTELLEKKQILRVVPQNFKNSNRGEVISVDDKFFGLKMYSPIDEALINKQIEFYSQTPNGMLYFASFITEISGETIKVRKPIKHRFLQRRAFSRVEHKSTIQLSADSTNYESELINISAGGMKILTKTYLDISKKFEITLNPTKDNEIHCDFEIIRIQKNENETFTISGRFKNLSDTDRMKLVNFCMRKSVENKNK